MDFTELKNWLTDPNERFIFVEDGHPAYVFMGFEAYKSIKGEGGESKKSTFGGVNQPKEAIDLANARLELERIKSQELAVKMAMEPGNAEETPPRLPAREPSEIRLEDLPL